MEKDQYGHSHKIKDLQAFGQLVRGHQGRALTELATEWPDEIFRYIKTLEFRQHALRFLWR